MSNTLRTIVGFLGLREGPEDSDVRNRDFAPPPSGISAAVHELGSAALISTMVASEPQTNPLDNLTAECVEEAKLIIAPTLPTFLEK